MSLPASRLHMSFSDTDLIYGHLWFLLRIAAFQYEVKNYWYRFFAILLSRCMGRHVFIHMRLLSYVNVSTSMPTTVSMRNVNTTPKKSTSPPLVNDSFLTVHIAQHYLIQQKLGSHLEYRVCTIPLSRYLWCTLHGGPHQTNEETPVQMGLVCKRGITQNCPSFLCATNGQI